MSSLSGFNSELFTYATNRTPSEGQFVGAKVTFNPGEIGCEFVAFISATGLLLFLMRLCHECSLGSLKFCISLIPYTPTPPSLSSPYRDLQKGFN